MKGILRLTYLTTNQLTFFYAEIFDGIFLLDWGPDEIAKILGLPENSPLPITIYSPETEIEKLKKQIETKKISSKFAFCGHDEGNSINQWLFGEVKSENDRKDEKVYEEWYEEKSYDWFKAIEDGRVELVDWTMEREFDLDIVVKDNIKKMKKLPSNIVGTNIVNAINEVLNMSDEKTNTHPVKSKNYVPRNKNNISIHMNNIVDNRAVVLGYIDKLDVDNQIKFLVFWWWNNLYMKAIANKYNVSYITFYPNVDLEKFIKNNRNDPDFKKTMDSIFSKLELKAPKTSRFKILKQNLNISPAGNKTLLINGEILKDVMKLTSSSFSQLKINIGMLSIEKEGLNGAKIYDISYIISSFLDRSNTYRSYLRSARWKLLIIVIPSIFVILYENEFLFTHFIFKVIWIISIASLALPWNEISEMMRLRKSNLSATITEVRD